MTAANPSFHGVQHLRDCKSVQGRSPRVVLVPCAGHGSRAQADRPKQYVTVAGRAVVHWTLQALIDTPGVDALLVVTSPGDRGLKAVLPPDLWSRLACADIGGDTRAQTVLNGLAALQALEWPEQSWVLVHDAARCLVQAADVQRLIQACEHDPVGGLLANPVPDTLKRDDGASRVAATVARERMWLAQTPQMVRLGLLQRSLQAALQAGATITDEASALEFAGHAAALVESDPENFKLTYPGDFSRAARILRGRQAGFKPPPNPSTEDVS